MKNTMIRMLAMALISVTALLLMTACDDGGVRVSDDSTAVPYVNDGGYSTRPTVALPHNQMDWSYLIAMCGPNMVWSDIEYFRHTDLTPNKAEFSVADGYGEEALLTVEYDKDSDQITSAVLSYGDISGSVLTDDDETLFKVFSAMQKAYEE